MALTAKYTVKNHTPEFGTLKIRDAVGASPPPGDELLLEWAVEAQPSGTLALAGAGWIEARTTDSVTVELEAHDGAPPQDHDGWHDIVETPFGSATGVVGLTHVTGGPGAADLTLGGPGHYRLRIACRRGKSRREVWRVQFWPAAPEAPRRLLRAEPAVARGLRLAERLRVGGSRAHFRLDRPGRHDRGDRRLGHAASARAGMDRRTAVACRRCHPPAMLISTRSDAQSEPRCRPTSLGATPTWPRSPRSSVFPPRRRAGS